MNYFKLFNLPVKININKKLLSKNYYQLQLKFHPDLFVNHSDFQKKIILAKSIEINKGYKILKVFLSRVIYLLSLHNCEINTETILLKNNDVLVKYFSLYEEIDDLKKNRFNKLKVINFLQKIKKKIEKHEDQIEKEFEKKNFKQIKIIIAKLLFFEKIKSHLDSEYNIFKKNKLG